MCFYDGVMKCVHNDDNNDNDICVRVISISYYCCILEVPLVPMKRLTLFYDFWLHTLYTASNVRWYQSHRSTRKVFLWALYVKCAQLIVCVCRIELMSPVLLLGELKSHKSIRLMYGLLKTSDHWLSIWQVMLNSLSLWNNPDPFFSDCDAMSAQLIVCMSHGDNVTNDFVSFFKSDESIRVVWTFKDLRLLALYVASD